MNFCQNNSHKQCSRPVNNIRTLLISPFTGAAGAGYNWDNYNNPNRDHWYLYQNVANFFEGLHLNSEIYYPWSQIRAQYAGGCSAVNIPQSVNDGFTTLYYLKKGDWENENDKIKIVGCVVNNLYNEYQFYDGYNSCGGLILEDDDFDGKLIDLNDWEESSVDYLLAFHPISDPFGFIIDNLRKNHNYSLRFYNPFNGHYLEGGTLTTSYCSLSNFQEGKGVLQHPVLEKEWPILFFELWDEDLDGVRSHEDSDSVLENDYEPKVSGETKKVTPFKMIVFPNPSAGNINIEIQGLAMEAAEYIVHDNLGNEIFRGMVNSSISLNFISSGTYSIQVVSENEVLIEKIIVLK